MKRRYFNQHNTYDGTNKTAEVKGKQSISKYQDTTAWIKDFTNEYELVENLPDTKYKFIETTQGNFKLEQENPVAATLIRAMKIKYGDKATFYLDNLEVLESTVLLAASDNLKLGFKIGADKNGRPSLFAAEGLPYKIEDLKEDYTKLTKGITQAISTMVYYPIPENKGVKEAPSGYGIPKDSIKFK